METVKGKVEEQERSFGLVHFNISNRHPTEEIEEIVELVSLNFKRKVWARVVISELLAYR